MACLWKKKSLRIFATEVNTNQRSRRSGASPVQDRARPSASPSRCSSFPSSHFGWPGYVPPRRRARPRPRPRGRNPACVVARLRSYPTPPATDVWRGLFTLLFYLANSNFENVFLSIRVKQWGKYKLSLHGTYPLQKLYISLLINAVE